MILELLIRPDTRQRIRDLSPTPAVEAAVAAGLRALAAAAGLRALAAAAEHTRLPAVSGSSPR